MGLKNNLVSWYIKNIIVPNLVKYDSPGFIITEQNTKFGSVFQRDVIFSESLLADFEKKLVEKYGKKGKQILYSTGKEFGYHFGKTFDVPTVKTYSKKEIIEISHFITMLIGATWANNAKETVNIDEKTYEIKYDNYVICNKNGLGHLLTEGACAGLWAYVMEDYSIEGVQTSCQGRGNNECRVVCGTKDFLESNGLNYIKAGKPYKFKQTEKYKEFNKIRKCKNSNTTMKELISSGTYKYENGKFEYEGKRYFPLEVSLFYFLEKNLDSKEMQNILFESSFNEGKNIASREQGNECHSFLTDYLSSQGWGDIFTTPKKKVSLDIIYFPWTELADKINFKMFSGLVSGVFSEFLKRKVTLKSKGFEEEDYFSLSLNEG